MTSTRSRFGRPSGTTVGLAVLAVVVGAIAAGGLFVWLGTSGPVLSPEPAVGSVALAVAGAARLPVVGYLGVGIERLYLTLGPLAIAFAGIAVGLLDRRWSVPVAVLFGAVAAGTTTVLGGCTCGTGSTAFLAERAAQRVLGGTALFV